MKSMVVYASRHGNTEKIAYAIAAGLRRAGPVEVYGVGTAPTEIPADVDLLAVGGPTEAHGITPPLAAYLERLGTAEVRTIAFDTRLRMARWLTGSAAIGIARRLRAVGARRAAEPISFFVAGKVPALEPGELERAEAWAAAQVESRVGDPVGSA